jgi:uncharacterized membrane protein YidH (DUF202 family)
MTSGMKEIKWILKKKKMQGKTDKQYKDSARFVAIALIGIIIMMIILTLI